MHSDTGAIVTIFSGASSKSAGNSASKKCQSDCSSKSVVEKDQLRLDSSMIPAQTLQENGCWCHNGVIVWGVRLLNDCENKLSLFC